uniref:Uncharacterized mitochondrial protein AtMg00810-like n=1 Tax=Nicotiana tabacum TaxID=4097 RepID=A0A1S4C630_TOBAC|nr:PREDICTED: uncharacterized mitochondrial protein AtMg00810-like [Nicotiana tabacum]
MDLEEIKALKIFLHDQFKIKDLGKLHYFLELEVFYKDGEVDEGSLLPDPTHYRKLVGKLNFMTNTSLDIAYSVQHLSQFMYAPREPHLRATIHVLWYLKNDPALRIFLSNSSDLSGYIVLLGDSPISWKLKKQEKLSLFSAEAEYRSIRKPTCSAYGKKPCVS